MCKNEKYILQSNNTINLYHQYFSNEVCPEYITKTQDETELTFFNASVYDLSQSGSNWMDHQTVNMHCMDNQFDDRKCSCTKYQVYHEYVIAIEDVPFAVEKIIGIYEKILPSSEEHMGDDSVLLFKEKSKEMYLFSILNIGVVWSIGWGLTLDDPPAARIDLGYDSQNVCPDQNQGSSWELFDQNTGQGQEIWLPNDKIKVKCVDEDGRQLPAENKLLEDTNRKRKSNKVTSKRKANQVSKSLQSFLFKKVFSYFLMLPIFRNLRN